MKDPKCARFYLLSKIYKRLINVPGRPGIYNSGYYTENVEIFQLRAQVSNFDVVVLEICLDHKLQ